MTAHSIRWLVALAAGLAALAVGRALAEDSTGTDTGTIVCVGDCNSISSQSHAARRRDRYFWYELSDAQYDRLVLELKKWDDHGREVWVLSATADSLDLAEDVDMALGDAGHRSTLLRPMDTVDGAHCTDAALAAAIEAATRIGCVVDRDETGSTGAIVVNFGRKIPAGGPP